MPKLSKDDCFADLKQRILTTDLEPGADLDEVNLSERYGISRTPLREVLQRLAGVGFVLLQANRGAKVASMDVAIMRVFFQTAPMIYANIARLAAENHTAEQIATLKEAQHAFTAATRDGNARASALCNHRFHEVIGQMAHNPYLTAALDRLLIDHSRMSQTFYRPASAEEQTLIGKAVQQHEGMIAAIEGRDPSLVVDLTLQHWDLSRDRLERFVRPDPLPVDLVASKEDSHAV